MRDQYIPFSSYDERAEEQRARAEQERQARRATWKVWNAGKDDYKIPPRGWLLGNVFCRGFLSALIADGGVGKTALRIAQLLSLATGRRLTGEHVFLRCRVLIVSLEDDENELRRRIYAALLKYGINPSDVDGWLFCVAPKGLRIAEMVDGSPQAADLNELIREEVRAHNIDIVSLDPFVKSHGLDENSNPQMDYVCGLLTAMASELDISVDFAHHTSKGIATAGDANKGRGATATKDAGRLVYTLTPMTQQEAELLGVSEADRRFLVRMDSGKVNIAPPPSDKATWFTLVGQPLGNATELYPAGDHVQTVEPWSPPDMLADLDIATINRILDEIDAGMTDGQRYSGAASAGEDRAAWIVVQRHAPGKPEKQCRAVVGAWVKSGMLFAENYDDPFSVRCVRDFA